MSTRSKKRKPAKSSRRAAPKPRKSPRPQELPGMENRKIAKLHTLALDYADIRDQRMELTKREAELKAKLLAAMKDEGKQSYRYQGVSIQVIHEEETVKVRVKDPDDDTTEASEPEAASVDVQVDGADA